ncbi:hypothetical protein ABZ816_12650 [Actinosynnema sp. NPDC047251]|uniref:Putative secreted protein n=1 Tax=Saccharothrix espanaensis (strain ATCC 51144 / DSM 44229 / JCM 9112 / NBRC 15066 / NRRL 15764) TaxID=1179773 RepID=K0K593_SACES|nr:hypothetical protein [Saccharothrix espanaensis]CCH35445.1 putative secreted protein [Saccharothrix espanaensis DSM 44229]
MPWELIERLSWLAGIVGAVIAAAAAWMAARAARGTMRDLALIVSVATDKPELLEAVEADARRRAEVVRRRVRGVFVTAGVAFLVSATGAVLGVLLALLPDSRQPRVVGGDLPRTTQDCSSAGEASVCVLDDHWALPADGAKVSARYEGVRRPEPKDGTARLTLRAQGCGGSVRWTASVAGAVAASGVVGEEEARAEFPVRSGVEFVLDAERVGGTCDVDLRVRPLVSFG